MSRQGFPTSGLHANGLLRAAGASRIWINIEIEIQFGEVL
jgi:hypothetical protein